ncbi:helix-turn-helix domain-containing protein [Thomasclavelia cocleata]|uniref:helix-turn-helix domain-containing protein n=1 Tax=Thomasclavelia cocleata TaxID=69824 RepID=UPI00257036BB|nr:helix-turn-helix transcriptional regulator [Thomasclavelia cocleata]
MNNRVKYLRKEKLHLSQEEFGNKISVSDTTISKVEKGVSVLTERNIKSICREFNVSPLWLKTGEGDIFLKFHDTLLDELANEYNLTEIEKKLVSSFLKLNQNNRKIITDYLKSAFLDD